MSAKIRVPRKPLTCPAPNWGRTIPLIWVLSLVAFISAWAIEPAFQNIRYRDNRLYTRLTLIDSLPEELVAYINKGVPISAEYTLELWRARSGWFDELVGRTMVGYKIRYDPWEKEYTVVRSTADLTIENLLDEEDEAIELLSSSGPITFAPRDSLGEYYLAGSLVIRIMSFSNFREVESWLKGEVSDIGKPRLEDAPDRVGEFIFDMALKISGLKNYSGDIKTGVFTLGGLSSEDTVSRK